MKATQLAELRLTLDQTREALVDYCLKNDEFKELVAEKTVIFMTDWQTNKWSDPNAFVHIKILESIPEDSDIESPGEQENESE